MSWLCGPPAEDHSRPSPSRVPHVIPSSGGLDGGKMCASRQPLTLRSLHGNSQYFMSCPRERTRRDHSQTRSKVKLSPGFHFSRLTLGALEAKSTPTPAHVPRPVSCGGGSGGGGQMCMRGRPRQAPRPQPVPSPTPLSRGWGSGGDGWMCMRGRHRQGPRPQPVPSPMPLFYAGSGRGGQV